MAVYTNVTEQEAAELLREYAIGELVTLKAIAQGVENSNFLLTTTTGNYILTLYEKRVRKEELPWYLDLMQYLAANGIDCPLPVETRDKSHLVILNDRPAAIVTFLEGKEVQQILPEHCFMLGVAMAELHQIGQGFHADKPNNVGSDSWLSLLQKSMNHGHEAMIDEIAPLLQDIVGQWPVGNRELPRGQIHADLFPDNVFFKENKLSGFIDFYFACTDFLAYDLAIALNAWCFTEEGTYLSERGSALLAGYQSIRALTKQEKTYFPLFAKGAALRFLLTRLHDWIHTPSTAIVTPKDPIPYLQRLRYFQKNTTPMDGLS